MPPHLLVAPPPLPKVQRTNEDMTGAQALASFGEIYGVAGGIRSTLITLQNAVRIAAEKNEEQQ
ncbi:MAG: hypothetical protein E2598_06475 [Sphingobium sp.]|nr:hypothetical protein [Sphingobium sp.]